MKWKLPAFMVGAVAAVVAVFSSKPTSSGGSGTSTETPIGPKDPHAPPWNPPSPGVPLQQKEVTPEMTAWAQSLVASQFPIHSLHPRTFQTPTGPMAVIGRVEWHTHQARTGKDGLFRAASLYHAGGVSRSQS